MFLNANGFEAFVPHLPTKTKSEFTPYIFTHIEISRIFQTADAIKANARYNCAEVYPVLFRVLYSCGLRISEALSLRVCDVDLNNGILTIIGGKNNRSRLVAMSESVKDACGCLMRKIHFGANGGDYFFKNRDGTKRSKYTVYQQFREILWASGIAYRGKGFGPRLHDLRHCFCCHALKQMSNAGIDMYCALPVLSAYIGHSSITSTERYLRLTEEFYPDVSEKVRMAAPQVYPEVYMVEAD
jgi:integrase